MRKCTLWRSLNKAGVYILHSQNECNINWKSKPKDCAQSLRIRNLFQAKQCLGKQWWCWGEVSDPSPGSRTKLSYQMKKQMGVCLQMIFNEVTQQNWIPPRKTSWHLCSTTFNVKIQPLPVKKVSRPTLGTYQLLHAQQSPSFPIRRKWSQYL